MVAVPHNFSPAPRPLLRAAAAVLHRSPRVAGGIAETLQSNLGNAREDNLVALDPRDLLSAPLQDPWVVVVGVDADGLGVAERVARRWPDAEIILCAPAAETSYFEQMRYFGVRYLLLEHEIGLELPAILRAVRLQRRYLAAARDREGSARSLLEQAGPAAVASAGYAVPPEPDFDSLEEAERRTLRCAVIHSGGNRSLAARRLGISRQRLYRLLERHSFDSQ